MKSTKGAKRKAPPRFGEVAVALGLVCDKDVARALELQDYRRSKGQEVPMLGVLLERMGHLKTNETRRILLECPKRPQTRRLPPQAPRPPTAKQRPTRRMSRGMTRGIDTVHQQLGWFKTKQKSNGASLRKQNAALAARLKSLEHSVLALKGTNELLKEELDAITEEMIAKEDLIEALREEIRLMELEEF